MVNGIRTPYLRGLNKGFGSKFCIGSLVRLKRPESRTTHQPKRSEFNNEDENNSPNTVSNKKKDL